MQWRPAAYDTWWRLWTDVLCHGFSSNSMQAAESRTHSNKTEPCQLAACPNWSSNCLYLALSWDAEGLEASKASLTSCGVMPPGAWAEVCCLLLVSMLAMNLLTGLKAEADKWACNHDNKVVWRKWLYAQCIRHVLHQRQSTRLLVTSHDPAGCTQESLNCLQIPSFVDTRQNVPATCSQTR